MLLKRVINVVQSKNILLIMLLAFFLHQSQRTSLGNISISDMVILLYGLNLIISNKLALSKKVIIIFFVLSIYGLTISLLYTPIFINIYTRISIISNYLKYLALFLFFIGGYNISSKNNYNLFIKYYSYCAVFIGTIGIALTIFSIPFMNETFFKYGERFNGFMNDPNYFAILQITSIPFFLSEKNINTKIKLFSLLTIILSIFISGSKTGILILMIYLFYKLLLSFSFRKLKKNSLLRMIVILIITFSSVYILDMSFSNLLSKLNDFMPVTSRLTSLFENFESQISAGGSTRGVAWTIGWEMVKISPFFGIGLVGYSTVSNQYFNIGLLPHNTYLQLAAEWGLLISVIFYSYLFYLLGLGLIIKTKFRDISIQLDILVIFLLGSFGISLNNARMFWLTIGTLVITVYKYRNQDKLK